MRTLRLLGIYLLIVFYGWQSILGLYWTYRFAVVLNWKDTLGSLAVVVAYVLAIVFLWGWAHGRRVEA